MNQVRQDFINLKKIAVVGVSRSENKFGNSTYRELKKRGYQIVPIHKEMESFDGDRCYQDLCSAPSDIEGVFVNVSPQYAPELVKDAKKAGIKYVWLQQGSDSKEAVELGESLGLSVAAGGCILMYAEPVESIHAFHRWIMKVLKKY